MKRDDRKSGWCCGQCKRHTRIRKKNVLLASGSAKATARTCCSVQAGRRQARPSEVCEVVWSESGCHLSLQDGGKYLMLCQSWAWAHDFTGDAVDVAMEQELRPAWWRWWMWRSCGVAMRSLCLRQEIICESFFLRPGGVELFRAFASRFLRTGWQMFFLCVCWRCVAAKDTLRPSEKHFDFFGELIEATVSCIICVESLQTHWCKSHFEYS